MPRGGCASPLGEAVRTVGHPSPPPESLPTQGEEMSAKARPSFGVDDARSSDQETGGFLTTMLALVGVDGLQEMGYEMTVQPRRGHFSSNAVTAEHVEVSQCPPDSPDTRQRRGVLPPGRPPEPRFAVWFYPPSQSVRGLAWGMAPPLAPSPGLLCGLTVNDRVDVRRSCRELRSAASTSPPERP